MNGPTPPRDPVRRRMLLGGAVAAAAGAFGPPAVVRSAPPADPPPDEVHAGLPLFRISLAQWSLHRTLFAGDLDPLDFAPFARREFDLGAVEYVNTFFKARAGDADYLGEMRRRAEHAGVRSLLIMVDGEGRLGDADPDRRAVAVENHRRWLDAASALGCRAIRVNAASSGSRDEQRKRAADGLRRLAEIGDEHDLDVIVENHGGLSSDGAWLASVMRTVDHPRCGTLPDFGNFHLGGGRWYDRYRGVRELMPWARAVSAKSHAFGDEGNETGTDYRRMMTIVLDAGYHGYVGIEYEGGDRPEVEGIRATQRLLRKVHGESVAAGRRRDHAAGVEADSGNRIDPEG